MNDTEISSKIDLIRTLREAELPLDNSAKITLLDDVVCEFVCDRVPVTVPDWIWAEHQGSEDRFYCSVDWQHPQLEHLLGEAFDPTDHLLALVQSLGFVNVDRIEWNARFEHEE